ncbi:MAG: hypothetical protein JSW04_10180 [Desulfobacterales bacterium]|nr:MAG: hypothetical protein JSW04_10180 [Desulfobacterales bacterium]
MYFIGNFIYANNQEETLEEDRRHGEFSLIIDAKDPYAALRRFRDRIIRYRERSDLFRGDCSVYLIQLFEFDMFPVDEAMMLNYKSTAGDPMMPFIRCSLPSDVTDSCRLFDWKNNIPEIDGQSEKLFLKFEAGSPPSLVEPDTSFLLTPET